MTALSVVSADPAAQAPALTSPEAERELLGTLLNGGWAWDEVADVVTPEDFNTPAHAAIWRAVSAVKGRGRYVTPSTVADAMGPDAGMLAIVGGPGYLTELAAGVTTSAGAASAAEVIRELATLRRLRLACGELSSRALARHGSASELAAQARQQFADLEVNASLGGPVRLGEGLGGVLAAIDERCQPDASPGVPTGFAKFDMLMGGLKPERLHVVAARPGIGKSSWLGTVSLRAARHGFPVLIFSLEMSFGEMAERFLAQETDSVPASIMANGRVSPADRQALNAAAGRVENLPLWVDDRMLTCAQICATARSWHARNGRKKLALVAIDYLGLIRSTERKAETRTLEVGGWAKAAKHLAKDLKAPVVLVSQLNRGNDKEQRPPRISDLRDSGEIEQHADMIMFPHREPPLDCNGPATLMVAKNRGGQTGQIGMFWRGEFMCFDDRPMTTTEELGGQE